MTLEVLGCQVFQIEQLSGALEISGRPGDYDVKLGFPDREEIIKAGAIIVDASLSQADIEKMGTTYTGRLFQRLISGMKKDAGTVRFNINKYIAALDKAGLFIIACPDDGEKIDESVQGVALAARVFLYLRSKWIAMEASAVQTSMELCRECGTCAGQCPLIEMREGSNGLRHSYLERYLCTGCGACTSVCPTGAIHITRQDNNAIGAALKSYLCAAEI